MYQLWKRHGRKQPFLHKLWRYPGASPGASSVREAPPAQNPGQVPNWAQAPGGMYQQQVNSQNTGGSLGFGGPADARAKQLMKVVGLVILGAFLLLVVCIALAVVIPIPGIRTFFLVVAILLILIPWIIVNRRLRIVRRTVGRIWWFM